jgi:hypothetical protein
MPAAAAAVARCRAVQVPRIGVAAVARRRRSSSGRVWRATRHCEGLQLCQPTQDGGEPRPHS